MIPYLLRRFFIATILAAGAGCADIDREIRVSGTQSMESQLRAAGFKIMIADTRERLDMLNGLPPETLTRIPRTEDVYYIYPDPDLCQCLYVGRAAEYEQLQRLQVDGAKANQALMMNEMRENELAGWNSGGAWGNWANAWMFTNPDSMGRPAWDPS